MPEAIAQELVRLSAAAARLGSSPWTVRDWIRTGKIEGHRINGRLFVSADAIDRIISQSKELQHA